MPFFVWHEYTSNLVVETLLQGLRISALFYSKGLGVDSLNLYLLVIHRFEKLGALFRLYFDKRDCGALRFLHSNTYDKIL
jgi:hypothetical protein